MIRRVFSFLGTKIGIALIVAICIIVGTLFATNLPEETPKDKSVIAADMIKRSLELDTDGDGLKDWEEAIYGTDPNNPDTDGDRMNDNDEIKANRNPLVYGPGESATIQATTSTNMYVPTATDRFSQELFMRYIEAKSSGAEINDELSEAIAAELINLEYDTTVKPFDVSMLNISSDNSAVALRVYGNTLGKILSTPAADPSEFEFTVLERMLTGTPASGDTDLLARIITRYNKMIDSLIVILVPAGIASAHSEFIQGLQMSRDIAVGISTLSTDPIGAYSKIGQYEEMLNVLTAATLKTRAYMRTMGITFSAQESGYVLIR
ncbi:MAG: hypothetical protein Q8L64_06510 [bacterium]|nr:hypothetical protein [bacterium]